MATPVDTFVALSSFLTGIGAPVLAPAIDPNEPPLKDVFYEYANRRAGTTLTQLLDVFTQNQGQPPSVIANAIFQNANPLVGFLARSIMLQWYMGNWYEPADLQAYSGRTKHGPVPSVVISDTAYVNGWSWSVAQAHPMGYSNYSFGYWASPPPPLSAFLGTTGKPQ